MPFPLRHSLLNEVLSHAVFQPQVDPVALSLAVFRLCCGYHMSVDGNGHTKARSGLAKVSQQLQGEHCGTFFRGLSWWYNNGSDFPVSCLLL